MSAAEPVVAERAESASPGHPQTPMAQPAGPHPSTRHADGLAPGVPGEPWTHDPYTHALRTGHGPLRLRRLSPPAHPDGPGRSGELLPLDIERWCAPPDAADLDVLHRCHGPVLDIGCGPGRMVAALAARGVRALGVDVSPAAVARTRRRGGAAVRRSVFAPLPGEGRWATLLLMDGNIGIGGDPTALLTRLRARVVPGGRLLAEAAPHDVDERLTVRVEGAQGRHGPSFPWARLGTTALLHAATTAGWILTSCWTADNRSFVELHRPSEDLDIHAPDAEGTDLP
ncbi:class I SAM-dependent methyltransferase [Streptomyces cyslabdanicus]|uniref:class I SAM-dependent methyltransferase n=1 Tax=Streptomyces cyslabdanicus TaxID=1470456 RepID=UPI00404442BF